MKMKYRITPKGKVVFSAAGIIILILVFMFIQSLQPDQNIESIDGTTNTVLNVDHGTDQTDMGSDEGDEAVEAEVSSESTNEVAVQEEEAELVESTVNDTPENQEQVEFEAEEDVSVSDADVLEDLYNAKVTVYFDPDKYDLKDEYKLVLNIFAGIAKENPEEIIKVEGNINGYPKFNDSKFGEELSDIRANKVAQYLMNMGVEETSIEVSSNGSSMPLNKTDSEEELMLNRRTDVYFKDFIIEKESESK